MITVLARKTRAALDVMVASAAVRRARRAVASRPVGSLVGRTDATVYEVGRSASTSVERAVGERWGAAVDRALRWTPGDSACLIRAGALRELLVSRGLPRAQVRIGVRRGPAGFEAHAWVEQDGIPIAEPVTLLGKFSSFDGVTLR